MSFAAQSAHPLLPPLALLHSKSPADSRTVIWKAAAAESSPSTSANVKSLAWNVSVVSSAPAVVVAPEVGKSLAPVIVIVTVIDAVLPPLASAATITTVSLAESPPSRASVSVSALFSVYVHAPVASVRTQEP